MDKLQANPFFDRYAEKIKTLQKSAPDEFQVRLEEIKKAPSKGELVKERGFSGVASPKESAATRSYLKKQKLDSIMKTDLIKDSTAEEIAKIWQEYHQQQDKIAAVIPADVYSTIFQRSQEFSTFLYPLPRDQGYEFIMAQFSGHECHFTSLINYQAYKQDAPECLTMIHYTELLQSKGIVLMRGEFNREVLSGADALCLANQVKLYYTSPLDGTKYKLLSTFNSNPSSFKHTDLIEELQKIIL